MLQRAIEEPALAGGEVIVRGDVASERKQSIGEIAADEPRSAGDEASLHAALLPRHGRRAVEPVEPVDRIMIVHQLRVLETRITHRLIESAAQAASDEYCESSSVLGP